MSTSSDIKDIASSIGSGAKDAGVALLNTGKTLVKTYTTVDPEDVKTDSSDTSIWYNYDYVNSKSLKKFNIATMMNYKNMLATNIATYASHKQTFNDYGQQWKDYGGTLLSTITQYKEIWSETNGVGDVANNLLLSLSQMGTVMYTAKNAVQLAVAQGVSIAAQYGDSVMMTVEDYVYNKLSQYSINAASELSNALNNLTEYIGNDSVIMSVIQRGIELFSNGALTIYKNGVDETSFGKLMESSWSKGGSSGFLSLIGKSVYFADSTPFDSGEGMTNLYGTMLLGVPPIFTHITDPKNRSMVATFVRDAKFLTLTPGFPQYNGSNMLLSENKDQYHQTTTAKSMLQYLLKNGLDEDSFNKDKRYYTFKRNYEEYYSYLETMLNTIWIKMGLSSNKQKYSIYTFFENPTDTSSSKLKSQYQSPLGFYVNPSGSVTENISSSLTGFGSNYASEVNNASDTYQQINYLTGMGTGGNLRNSSRLTSNTLGLVSNVKSFLQDVSVNTINGFKRAKGLGKILSTAFGAVADVRHFTTEIDPGSVMQAMSTTNGMKVVYPELWSDSTFSRSININFEFISPYGDPLSIFQFVMAPFCALFCFAAPRQAADNGYVSPFFVRADIPGLFTSDLAIISDFSWSRGGNAELWTKDGLPRAISGSFTVQDLYPYLAMTKRLSFLSANPNYTTFLDNLAGLHAINTGESNDALNDYWKTMLNRVSGATESSGLYNKYSSTKSYQHNTFANTTATNRLGGNTMNNNSSPWLRKLN